MTEERSARKRAYDAVWRAANREKARAYGKAYYLALKTANPEKLKAYDAVWRAANPEKIAAKGAAYRAANPEKLKVYQVEYQSSGKAMVRRRMKKYGLSPEAFQLMLLMQKNACGVCKEIFSKEPQVDHCHKTGEVRGLLCGRCNKGLGLFRDSPNFLKSALEYLEA